MKRSLSVLVLMLGACGGSQPSGPVAGRTYFWEVLSSTVEFGTCTDDAQFRQSLMPMELKPNSFVMYKVEAGGKTATLLDCKRIDPSSCTPTMDPTITVANPELIFSTEDKSPVGTAGCQLLDTTTWLLTANEPKGTLDVSHVLSLVDNPSACEAAEKQIKAQSPNQTGLEGCVVTFKFGLSLR
jgi:hypothetical protein